MSIDELVDDLIDKISYTGDVDYVTLTTGSRLIDRIGSITIGVLSLLIVILVPLVVALEVFYICFPVIRNKADDLLVKVEGHGIAHNLIEFTLRDAVEAVKQANTKMTGTSAMAIYLKIKCKSVMFLMFIVVFVIRGSSSIIAFVDGFIRAIISLIFQ